MFITDSAGRQHPDFSEEIARGVAFLDAEVGSTWLLKIDPDLLDLINSTACVCGQVFEGHYDEGCRRLYLASDDPLRPEVAECCYVAEYGFALPAWARCPDLNEIDKSRYSQLTEQWLDAIGKLIADRGLVI